MNARIIPTLLEQLNTETFNLSDYISQLFASLHEDLVIQEVVNHAT